MDAGSLDERPCQDTFLQRRFGHTAASCGSLCALLEGKADQFPLAAFVDEVQRQIAT